MRIRVLSVGKESEKPLRALIDEYIKRLPPHLQPTWEYLPSSSKAAESDAILKRVQTDEYVVLLDERGDMLSSTDLAERIQSWQTNAMKSIVFIIGGAFGVSEAVLQRADIVLSFSRMVFPHQIVRLLLIEQLYRAYDISRGGKYHHV